MGTCCKPAGGRWKKARPREFSNAQHVLFVGRLPRYVRVFEFRGSKFFNRADLVNIFRQMSMIAMIGVGMTMVIIAAGDRFECWFYGDFLWNESFWWQWQYPGDVVRWTLHWHVARWNGINRCIAL